MNKGNYNPNDNMPFTHLRPEGGVKMVDVGHKAQTARKAVARCSVTMNRATLSLVTGKEMIKGDVLTTAQIAGIMAAKRTWEFIPLCHVLNLSCVDLSVTPNLETSSIDIEAVVKVTGNTGAEMEALAAVSVAGLTVYDMCKAVDKSMVITDIRLVEKSGGKSGPYTREGEQHK